MAKDDEDHGYTWRHVREVPAEEIQVRATWVNPGAFAAYRVAADGRVAGCGLGVGMGGTAWTCTARKGNTVTARNHRGLVASQEIRPGQRVLRVDFRPLTQAEKTHARATLRRAEAKLARLIDGYRNHGCSDEEVEAMAEVVASRTEVAFQRGRLEPGYVTRI